MTMLTCHQEMASTVIFLAVFELISTKCRQTGFHACHILGVEIPSVRDSLLPDPSDILFSGQLALKGRVSLPSSRSLQSEGLKTVTLKRILGSKITDPYRSILRSFCSSNRVRNPRHTLSGLFLLLFSKHISHEN
jgi:hypothetical protein